MNAAVTISTAIVAVSLSAVSSLALEAYVLDQIIPASNSFVAFADVCRDTNGTVFGLGNYDTPSVLCLATDGTVVARWGDVTTFMQPVAIDCAPDQTLVIAAGMQGPVKTFTQTGTLVRSWGAMGWMPGQIMNLVDLTVNPVDGHVFLLDMPMGNHRIQEYTADGTFLNVFPLSIRANSIGTDGTNLYCAGVLGMDGVVARSALDGTAMTNLFFTNGFVTCQNVTLKPGGLLSFNFMGNGESNLITCDRNGGNVVTTLFARAIGRHAYDRMGNLATVYAGDSVAGFAGVSSQTWEYGRARLDALAAPYEICGRPDGLVCVAENSWAGRNFHRLYSNGIPVAATPSAVRACGVAYGVSNSLVLSDATYPYRIVLLDGGSEYSITGITPSATFSPGRIDADAARIYAVNNAGVVKIDATGLVYATYMPSSGAADVRLISTTNIAVLHTTNISIYATTATALVRRIALPLDGGSGTSMDTDGSNFFTSTSLSRMVKCDSQGSVLATFGSSGSQPGAFDQPTGVMVDDAGRVWVCDQGNNRIQIFRRSLGVVYQSHSISNGDSDFAIEPYEDIWLSIAALNGAGRAASNVVGTLFSPSPYVVFVSNSLQYGTMADGALVTNPCFHVRIASNAPNATTIPVGIVFAADSTEQTTNEFGLYVSYSFTAGGTVRFSGAPTNAAVSYAAPPYATWNAGVLSTTGAFSFVPGAQSGTIALRATAPGYDDSAWQFITLPPDTNGIVLDLGDADIAMAPVDIVMTTLVSASVSTGFWISSAGSAPLALSIKDTAGGYGYVDNRVPSGPAFQWKATDLSWNFFTNTSDLSDYPARPPFDIGVFGHSRTEQWVNVNGVLSLSFSPIMPSQGQQLPYSWMSPGDKDVVAPYWTDQNIVAWWSSLSGSVAWTTDGGTCQWTSWESVQNSSPPATNSYQVAQYSSGEILLQYKDIGNPRAATCIGIQNHTASKALSIQYNEFYVTNGTALMIYNDRWTTDWLSVSCASAVATGSQAYVSLDINGPLLLTGGWHRAAVCIRHNDGATPVKVGQVSVYAEAPPEPPPSPFVDITNDTLVADIATPVAVAGTNNSHVVGGMWVSNATLAGAAADFPAVPAWVSTAVPIGLQTNLIHVYGSNLAGQVAYDTVVVIGVPEPCALVLVGAWIVTARTVCRRPARRMRAKKTTGVRHGIVN